MAPSTASTDVLSVDLGTATTAAVIKRPGADPVAVEFDGEPLLPSGVCAVPGGRLTTGRDARDLADTRPDSYEPAPKRRIGDETVPLGPRDYSPDELVAAVLGRVLGEVHGRPGSVVLTFPAGWGPERRVVLIEAARRLGVTDPMLLPEPIAAARHVNALHPRAVPVGHTTVIYDLGAGTFDATVLRRTPNGFTQLSTEALSDAGGDDIDAAVVEHLTLTAGVTVADRHFPDRVRAAKELLSTETSATVRLAGPDRVVSLTRPQLETIARPILDRTVTATRAALVAAGPPATRVASVFLIGGSSRIPLVAELVQREFGLAPILVDQPDLVIARGAARPGSRLAVPAVAASAREQPRPALLSRLARAVTRPTGGDSPPRSRA